MKVKTPNGRLVALYPNVDFDYRKAHYTPDVEFGESKLRFSSVVPFKCKDGEVYAFEVNDNWIISEENDKEMLFSLSRRFNTYCFNIFNYGMITDRAFKLDEVTIQRLKELPNMITEYKYILNMINNDKT